MLGSVGGRGGDGSKTSLDSEKDYDLQYQNGANGGRGGDVSFTQTTVLPAKTALWLQASGTGKDNGAVIQLYSQGGKGGYSLSDAGKGGDGGTVKLVFGSETTQGSRTVITSWMSQFAAVWAQSRGGDGGNGGSFDRATGGKAGNVSVTLQGETSMSTNGSSAPVVIAESLGGNGGTESSSNTLGVAPPGGGNAAEAKLTVGSAVQLVAYRASSPGVIVQSVGGAGGYSSAWVNGSDGSPGGNGGAAIATLDGTIETKEAGSPGLIIQSVGGVGGKGGRGLIVGGDGGNAGSGGSVTATQRGTIETDGTASVGILAQSVGGGSATGAFRSAIASAGSGGSGGNAGILFFGWGGDGGRGGTGGTVTVENSGVILTKGDRAAGILAQSIGGGGGGGGDATAVGLIFSAALGGKGADGNTGGDVTVRNAKSQSAGSITTKGQFASGILAQSIGGGGGVGGDATAISAGPQVSIARAVGGSGGKGSTGGTVSVVNELSVNTTGRNSSAISAMSIGGGGGAGGDALAFTAAIGAKTYPSVSFAWSTGGNGGTGNLGGKVSVTNAAEIKTEGSLSHGINALSIGGGGGDGGTARSASLNIPFASNLDFNFNITTGGNGGSGGKGGTVEVTNSSGITTKGTASIGIAAYSIGGGGGNGGNAEVLAKDLIALAKGFSITGTWKTGGKGGDGNEGGTVKITNTGDITTEQLASTGIVAASIGGGGGNGGDTRPIDLGSLLSGTVSTVSYVNLVGQTKSLSINNGVGGAGGVGNIGGTVTVDNSGSITTRADGAAGILAQSVGGGGGIGGLSQTDGSGNVSGTLTIGGNGGNGNNGGSVTVTTTKQAGQTTEKQISTGGNASYAIFAQSIGGGGGSGGAATSSSGGIDSSQAGTLGKAAAKNLLAYYLSSGTKAKIGVFAESIMARIPGLSKVSGATREGIKGMKPSFPVSVSLNHAVGGEGGAGGNGGSVTVTNAMKLSTGGNSAAAIFAQSVGGGGGNGGVMQVASDKLFTYRGTTGGSGSGGGSGGAVTVTSTGVIETIGKASSGIIAQSVGGGGGISTTGIDFQASGNAYDKAEKPFNFTWISGGTNGIAGDGKAVTVSSSAAITTKGNESHGIVAQSIGGGGGVSIVDVYNPDNIIEAKKKLDESSKQILKSYGLDIDEEFANATKIIANTQNTPLQQTVELGGKSSAPSAGGIVTVNLNSSISTGTDPSEGAGSGSMGAIGIIAQSIGGGGGMISAGGGAGVSLKTNLGGILGGVGSRGDGDAVTVNFGNASSISTKGDGAIGVLAQSIGGGGGYVGAFSPTQASFGAMLSASINSAGSGGKITISSKQDNGTRNKVTITTTGAKAHGVFAQSLGGGGGMVFGADIPSANTIAARQGVSGSGKPIEINLAGTIQAKGSNSYGIFAQSGVQGVDGQAIVTTTRGATVMNGGGRISIDYSGTIVGGSGNGAAIRIDGGSIKTAPSESNKIVIGAGSSISAVSNKAILSSFGSESVSNFGTITGDINLATGGTTEWNEFRNEVGGTYISAGTGTINVSNGSGWFYNAGTFNVGGVGTIATATVKTVDTWLGGVLMVDVNSVAAPGVQNADVLKTAAMTLDGVAIQPHAVDGLLPGTFTVISASSIANNKAPSAGASPASPISWTAAQSGNTVTISPYATFLAKASGSNPSDTERSLLNSLQTAWNTSDVGKADTFAELANVVSAEQYRMKIESMSRTENVGQSASSQTLGARDATRFSMSCPVFEGTTTMVGESQCVWSRVTGSRVAQFDGGDADGFTATAMSYRVGGQWEFSPDWFLGATAAYNTDWVKTSDGLTSIDGSGGDVSVALKHQMGPWLLAGALSAGYGSYESSSTFFIGGDGWQALNTSDVWTASLRLRAAYEFAFANWYVRPYADLDVIHTYMPGYTLAGDGAVLRAGDMREWTVAFEPTLEVGARVNIEGYGWLRPYASVGATFIGGNGLSQNVTFSDGGDSGLNFTSTTDVPDTLFDIGAGVQFMANDKYELRGEYKAQIADDYLGQEVSLRMAIRF
ncbi:autotransporter outer membrane beta-barrel domain-containing protein [Pseudoxanthobacter soli]|uniref:autotransporter outer membrane beta-barrel domain-containing protein n=1 Tax=Pseudoxanthobacter soli TaxID=433840 RepID=UPI000937BD7D|nr:autotransporter outer membrane beta-barrel domain-containing protein [Pseudoxanthobacter soli]